MGLVGYWPGNSDAIDHGGSNDGTWSTGVAYESGILGNAFSFSASDNYVSVPSNSIFAFNGQKSFSFWFRTPTVDDPSYQSLVNTWNNDSDNTHITYIDYRNLYLYVPSTGQNIVSGGATLESDTNYFVVVTRDGSDWTMYLNGVVGSIAIGSSIGN